MDPDIKDEYTQQFIDNSCAVRDIMYTCGNEIDKIFSGSSVAFTAYPIWHGGIKLHTKLLPYFNDRYANEDIIEEYVKKIGKYNPDYVKNYFDEKEKKLKEKEEELDRYFKETEENDRKKAQEEREKTEKSIKNYKVSALVSLTIGIVGLFFSFSEIITLPVIAPFLSIGFAVFGITCLISAFKLSKNLKNPGSKKKTHTQTSKLRPLPKLFYISIDIGSLCVYTMIK